MQIEDYKIMRTRKYYPYPANWNLSVHSSSEAAQVCGQSFDEIYFLHDNCFVTSLYPIKKWSEIGNSIVDKIVKNENYISEINTKQKLIGAELKKLSQEIIAKCEKETLFLEELNKSTLLLKKTWQQYNNLELSWYIGAEFLKEYIYKGFLNLGIEMTDEDFHILTTPQENTFSAEEEAEILETAIKLAEDKNIDQNIKDLVGKYYWIPFGYDGPTLYDNDHYTVVIKEMVQKHSLSELENQLEKLGKRKEILKKDQEEVVAKYKLDAKSQVLINDIQAMMIMADNRKEYTSYAQVAYGKLLDQYSKNLKIDKISLKYLDVEEIVENIDNLSKIESLIKERSDCFLSGAENHIVFNEIGPRAQEFKKILITDNQVDFVKGMVASKGENSIVKGKVKVLFVPTDLNKVVDGDIIVSPMTTPQFTSALRKAAAVITDEGGITCHAAIISRELNIPCIIGTQNATKVFHDNDLIEINVDKGIAKKVKEA